MHHSHVSAPPVQRFWDSTLSEDTPHQGQVWCNGCKSLRPEDGSVLGVLPGQRFRPAELYCGPCAKEFSVVSTDLLEDVF